MESVEEIRQATQVHRVTGKPSEPQDDTEPYRPAFRPSVPLLCVLDDAKEDGEWVRVRSTPFVIGRTEGDLRFPLDGMMSSRHAELACVTREGRNHWYLHDLDSTNGTFVRVTTTVLASNQEILIGRRRFRFCAGGGSSTKEPRSEEKPIGTRGWQTLSGPSVLPTLLELNDDGEGQPYLLTKTDLWIGREGPQCSVVLADDQLVSPRHARIYRDEQGQWHLENAKSRNGVWIRAAKAPIGKGGQFQLGEQRFLLRMP